MLWVLSVQGIPIDEIVGMSSSYEPFDVMVWEVDMFGVGDEGLVEFVVDG